MRKLLLFLAIIAFTSCSGQRQPANTAPITQADYLELLKDSCAKLNAKIDTACVLLQSYENYLIVYENESKVLKDSIVVLNDSIIILHTKQLMKADQFIELYKYARLLKYYNICKRKPSQWVYYKGWSIRVFEE